MTSARQIFNILQYTFSGSNNNVNPNTFVEPTATFSVTPTTYSLIAAPANITVIGSIIPNDATNITWEVYDGVSVSPVLSGSNNVINGVLPPPTIDTTYTLLVSYIGGNALLELTSVVNPYNVTYVGQLPLPSDNITVAADLVPFLSGLTSLSEAEALLLMTVTANYIGRIVIVVPDDYGTLLNIADENDLSALAEFNTIVDAPNNQKIYIKINTVTPGSYKYKLIY
jgi:hypothetical protein